MDTRKRNTALVLAGAVLFLLLENQLGFFVIAALSMIGLGIYKIRMEQPKIGYVLLGVGIVILLSGKAAFIILLALIGFGVYYLQSKQNDSGGENGQKRQLIESVRRDKEPWELKTSSVWHLIGEMRLDLSFAILEQPETTVVMQGFIGDIDIIVPPDMGVEIHATVMLGQIDVAKETEAGLMNKLVWKSPGYEASRQKVRFILSYMIGDIDVKMI